jgi:hypothetical protein
MRDFRQLQQLADDLMEREEDNIKMMDEMHKYDTMVWDSDAATKMKAAGNWVHTVVPTDLHDVLSDGTSLMASHNPKLQVTPLGQYEEDLIDAGKMERSLLWNLDGAFRRRGNIRSDIFKDALKYDRVALQVEYLPHQLDTMKAFTNTDLRTDNALRLGKFALIRRDPRGIYPIWSDLQLEGVLNRQVVRAQEIYDFWGNLATPLWEYLDKAEDTTTDFVTMFDYCDYEQRAVWVIPQGDNQMPQEPEMGNAIELFNEPHNMPFLPWVVRDGGDVLQPILYPIYKGKLWDTMCILATLQMSEIMAYSTAPRLKQSGIGEVEIDYTEPGRTAYVPPGAELEEMTPPAIDQAIAFARDMVAAAVSKATLPRGVQQGEFPEGAAFASIREMIQLGVKKLNRAKELSQRAYEDIFRQMIYWVDYTGDELISYVQSTEMPTEQIVISGKDVEEHVGYDVNNLYFKVELTPDIPLDAVQRINSGVLGKQMGLSDYTVKDMIGIDDPEADWDKFVSEERRKAELNAELMLIEGRAQLELEREAMIQQMELEQMMAGGIPQEQPPPGMLPTNEMMAEPNIQNQFAMQGADGFENIGGPGFDPNQGGSPPAMANPSAIPELGQGQEVLGGS